MLESIADSLGDFLTNPLVPLLVILAFFASAGGLGILAYNAVDRHNVLAGYAWLVLAIGLMYVGSAIVLPAIGA